MSTPGKQQSKTPRLSRSIDQKSLETVFDCHLSPHWRQMAIDNTVSIDFDPRASISVSVFDCRLPGVMSCICS